MTKRKRTTKRTTSSDAPDREQLAAVRKESENADQPATKDEGPEKDSPEVSPSDAPTKRGRPKGSRSRMAQEVIPPGVIRAFVAMPYTLAARFYGPEWNLSDAELDNMVPVHQELAAEYLPDWLRAHPALYGCLTLHALAIIGRVGIAQRLKAARVPGLVEEVEDVGSEDLPRKTGFGEIHPSA